jgi:hypothetical protein
MIKKVAVIALVIVASLSIAGCTVGLPSTSSPSPTPTPTPVPTPVDYSSKLTSVVESGNFIMTRPFTKSTNSRGNDVYKGVGRNATMSGSKDVTLVFELTNSKTEAKRIYDEIIASKLREGYTLDSTELSKIKASTHWDEVWFGRYGSSWFECSYAYDYGPEIPYWTVTQQSSS